MTSNLELGSFGSLSPIPPAAPPVDSSPPDVEMTEAAPITSNPLLNHIDQILNMRRVLPTPGNTVRAAAYNAYFDNLKKLRDLAPPFYFATKMTTSLTRLKDTESPGDGWSEGSTARNMEDFPSAAARLVADCFFVIIREHTERLSRLVQLEIPPTERREFQIECE